MTPLPNHNFAKEVELICRAKNIEYIEAVILWCEQNKLEVETAAFWIKKDPMMKAKIQAEAEVLNILKRGARLPL